MGRMTPGLQSDVSDLRCVCRDSSCSRCWVTVHVSPALTDSSTLPCTGFQLCHVLPIMGWNSHLLLYNKWLQILQPKAIHIYCLKVSMGQGSGHSFPGDILAQPRCEVTVKLSAGLQSTQVQDSAPKLTHVAAAALQQTGFQACLGGWLCRAVSGLGGWLPPKQVTLRQKETGHPRWESWLFTTEPRLSNFAAFWFVRSNSSNPANTWEEGVTPEPLLCTEMGRLLGPCESLPTTRFSPTDLAQGLPSCISSLS